MCLLFGGTTRGVWSAPHSYFKIKMTELPWPPRNMPILTEEYQVHHIQLPSPSVNQYTSISNVGTIAFDTHEELLWIGDNYVSIIWDRAIAGSQLLMT